MKKEGNKTIDRALLMSFVALAWPTIVEQFLETIVQYVDTAMVGHLGANATATVSLSSTYNWLLNSVMMSLGIAFLAYIARAIGEKNEDKIHRAAGQAVGAVLAIGIVLTVLTLWAAPYMPVWMGADKEIHRDGSMYFALVNAPMIFRAAMVIFGAAIRSTGDTKNPMLVTIMVNVLNTILNYVFIYLLGFGAVGAGYATAIAFCIGGIVMTLLFVKNPILGFSRKYVKPDRVVLRSILGVGIPIMLTRIVSCSGYVVATSFVSSMETAIFAAHSIAITAETIFYIPGYGMQAATSTLIGNAIGEKDRAKEKGVIRISLLLIFVMMCVTGVLLFISAEWMMALFTDSEEVITIGARLLRIVAFTEPIFGSTAVMEGIYNGMGRTKYPFIVEVISRWGVRILGSYICIRMLGYGIDHIWYCMIGDNILKAILLGIGLIVIFRKKGNKKRG